MEGKISGEQSEKNPHFALLAAVFSVFALFMGSVTSFLGNRSHVLVYSKPTGEAPTNEAPPVNPAPGPNLGLYMRILVSLVGMAGSLRVILVREYKAPEKHWAFGTMGIIVGYWFRGG